MTPTTIKSTEEFYNWLATAKGGQIATYHVGNLCEDRQMTIFSDSTNRKQKPVTIFISPYDHLGRIAREAYDRGEVELVQRRVRNNLGHKLSRFEYLVIKRKTRRYQ